MATQVFISWSGELGKKLAEAVREWLPVTLQFVKPYFTPVDIEKGARWVPDIATELSRSHVGIICLTKENLSSPWILFEAGALSRNLDRSRVCPLLFGLDPADVTGPLAIFQATRFTREEFKALVETINNAGDAKLEPSVLEEAFDTRWSRLDDKVSKILAEHQPATQDAGRPVPEMVKEILELTRSHVQRQQSDSLQKDKEMQSFLNLFAAVATGGTSVERAIHAWIENWVAERSKAVHCSARGTFSSSLSSPPKVPPSGSPEPSPSPSASPGPEEE